MSDCLINPLKWIFTEGLWPLVKPHFDYWWCFDGNVQGLRDEIGRLERERRDMEGKIEDARLRAESATTEVQNWSNEGTQKLEEATRILQGCDDLKLWKIISRYSVGKSAKKTTEGISKLLNEGNSIRIADPTPPASMVSISHAPTLEFHSRKRIEEDIMESLKDGNVRMIAICGVGGVGKTTMEQRIEDRVRKEKLFDEVLLVVISQQIDMFKIQKQIAEMLGLGNGRKLQRIVAGVISSLVGLEELKIVDCFNKWEAKGNVSEERNASLSELESLSNLTCLEIDIFDPNLVAQEILLSKQLTRYRIRAYEDEYFFDGMKHERRIALQLPKDVTVGNWIRRLVKNTQSLELCGDGSNDFNLGEIESLRELVFRNCSTVEKLMKAIDWKFPMLEHLELTDLGELEEIIDGTIPEGSNSFQNLESLVVVDLPKLGYLWKSPNQNVSLVNLKSIDISSCPDLRYLFSMATARSLVQLQSLEISLCDTIEQVWWNEMESNTEASIIEFPKLEALKLFNLPNLLAFTQGVEIIKFPQLIELVIEDCPKLRTKIDQFPAGMIEKIVVSDRDNIEEIFRDDGNRHIIFRELNELDLRGLPCLTTFYGGVESIKFPKLKVLTIGNLPRLNSFVAIDSEPTHDHDSLHLFCNKKVEIIGLETLHLYDFPNKITKIWCRHIPTSFFHNLESLFIYKFDGIKNLISSSIAKALVNLNTLDIEHCKEMIDVIEDETHVPVNCVFPNLQNLIISDNCKLRSFSQWNHAFELPSLISVKIYDCPLMKTFTLGSLSTPKLHSFYINGNGIEMKDLNDGIHRFTSTKNATKMRTRMNTMRMTSMRIRNR